MLFDLIGTIGQYRADRAKSKAERAMQNYRNKMAHIANAINQNAITQNTTFNIQTSARKAVHIKRDEMSTLGATATAAAASGVRGNSVTAALLNVKRMSALNDKARTDDLEQYFITADQQRLGSTLSAVQNQDLSYIPKPSLGGYMLGYVARNAQKIGSMMMGGIGG